MAGAAPSYDDQSQAALPADTFAPGRLDGLGDMPGFTGNPGDSAITGYPGASTSSDIDPDYGTGAASTSADAGFAAQYGASTSSDGAFAPGRLDGLGDMPGFQGNPGDSAITGYPDAPDDDAAPSTYGAESAAVAAATVSGDAGLYCNGDQDFSVTALFGKSVEELAQEIADESERNQSEE